MSKLIIPSDRFEPVTFQRGPAHLTDYGWDWLRGEIRSQRARWENDLPPIAGGSGQMSSWAEQAVLNHLTGQDNASWANLSPVYLALCTVVPTSSSTGSTITEATYTTYARTSMSNTAWNAASGTAPASATNAGTVTCPACTASTSTIIAMAICTALTVGNVIFWMSCASTVISTTQTPPTVAAAGISNGLT
jgi:hypothetical protein